MVRRTLMRIVAVVAALAMMAAPAMAHVMVVDPPGKDGVMEKWVGGPILPVAAQGNGLFDAPPFAPGQKQSAGHSKGLINACHATASNSVVTIFGPPFAHTCHHGGPPPAP